jgi:hypothetical protein
VTAKDNLTAGAKQGTDGRYPKGQSGNPGGRAKMPAEVRDMLTAKAKDAVETCIKHLKDGDPRVSLKAAELLLDRAYRKPTPASEVISFSLPEDTEDTVALVALHASLLRATAAGEIAVADAREMSALFESHRRLIEVADLEERILKLEQSKEGKR